MAKQMKTAEKKLAEKKPATAPKVKAATATKAKPMSKLGQLEAMLRRPDGATIAQVSKALAWQAHTVRGAMSGSLKKKQGLKITAAKEEGEDRVYRITG